MTESCVPVSVLVELAAFLRTKGARGDLLVDGYYIVDRLDSIIASGDSGGVEELPTCEVTEGHAPNFYLCGLPATVKATTAPYWFLCKDHGVYALIAGWKPKPVERALSTKGEEE